MAAIKTEHNDLEISRTLNAPCAFVNKVCNELGSEDGDLLFVFKALQKRSKLSEIIITLEFIHPKQQAANCNLRNFVRPITKVGRYLKIYVYVTLCLMKIQ